MRFLKDNWLTILIGVVVGMCSSLGFNLFFLNNSFGNSFDLGGFLGSIIGVIGAYGIAKWQFEKQNNAERELNKEIYLRQKKIEELSEGISILEKLIYDIRCTKKLIYKYIQGDKNKEFFEKNNIEIQRLSENFNYYSSFSKFNFIEINYSKEEEKDTKKILNYRDDIDYSDLDAIRTKMNILSINFIYLANLLKSKEYSNVEIYMKEIHGLLEIEEESLCSEEKIDLEERAKKVIIQLLKIQKYNLNKYKEEP